MVEGMMGRYVAALGLMLGIGAAGCNVDGRWGWRPNDSGAAQRSARSGTTGRGSGTGVDISIADAREVDLVEELVNHRTRYSRSLERLHEFYASHGFVRKANWVAFEMKGLRGVKQFRYLMDAEVASDALHPVDEIAEADALYQKGLELMRSGGHNVPGLYREDRMVEAANVFRDLIERYPSSDKIDDAAFFLGEIHKEYLPGQEEIAVKWYERAWAWNPQTPHPARFQAAVVYDYRLHDRDRALELYQLVVRDETDNQGNVRSATRRIAELTASSDRTARASGP